jgi:hypothetical protein
MIVSRPWCERRTDTASFNHLIGAAEKWKRDGEAERLGGFEIEKQLNFRGQLYRQVAGLLAFQNAGGINASPII